MLLLFSPGADAAHALTPALGQGANLAFEDGLELARQLASHSSLRYTFSHLPPHSSPRFHWRHILFSTPWGGVNFETMPFRVAMQNDVDNRGFQNASAIFDCRDALKAFEATRIPRATCIAKGGEGFAELTKGEEKTAEPPTFYDFMYGYRGENERLQRSDAPQQPWIPTPSAVTN